MLPRAPTVQRALPPARTAESPDEMRDEGLPTSRPAQAALDPERPVYIVNISMNQWLMYGVYKPAAPGRLRDFNATEGGLPCQHLGDHLSSPVRLMLGDHGGRQATMDRPCHRTHATAFRSAKRNYNLRTSFLVEIQSKLIKNTHSTCFLSR